MAKLRPGDLIEIQTRDELSILGRVTWVGPKGFRVAWGEAEKEIDHDWSDMSKFKRLPRSRRKE